MGSPASYLICSYVLTMFLVEVGYMYIIYVKDKYICIANDRNIKAL